MSVPAQSLLLDRISQRYGAMTVVDDITLDIRPGELVALLGPSGCGKTTLLKAIGGFVRQSAGRIVIGGQAVDALPPNRRRVGIVFQNYALFPHMTVAQNVAYGLDVQRLPGRAKAARVAEMLDLVQMGHLASRMPRQLSGGQQQRVAIARALAVRPGVLLLDEPFAALDKALRLDMQIEVKRIQRTSGTTTVLVTHDQEEALSMADRVAVLRSGTLEQFASPTEIYDRPASLFVNTFVGHANVLAGTVAPDSSGTVLRLDAGGAVPLQPGGPPPGSKAVACLRPEALELHLDGDGLPGTVEIGLPLGPSIVHEVRLAGGSTVKVASNRADGAVPLPAGQAVRVRLLRPATAFPSSDMPPDMRDAA